MLALRGLRRAERFVTEQQARGNDVRWDGWTMVFFRAADFARKDKNGVFRNGTWGFDNRVEPNTDGVWEVEYRNVAKRAGRRTKRTRN